MGALHFPAMLLLQDAGTMANDVHLIMICEVILTAVVVLLLLGIAIAGLVIASKVNKLVAVADAKAQPLLAQATPLIAKSKEIAGHVNDIVADLKPKIAIVSADLTPKIAAVTSDLQPKIKSVSSDVQHISSVVRSKVDEAGLTFTKVSQKVGETVEKVSETVQEYNVTAQEVNVKAKGQVERVNGMVSEALTTTQQVSKQIQHGIKVPVEKVASWVTAAKNGIESLSDRIPFLNANQPGKARKPAPSRPGPVPVPPAGARVVHTAADVAQAAATQGRTSPTTE